MSEAESTGTETEGTESLTETEGQETQETEVKELRDAEGWPVWLGQSPKRHKRNEAFKKHDTIGDLQDAHLKLITEKDEAVKASEGTIKVPTDESTDEEIQEFYSKLGRPKDAEGYEFDKVELPDGIPLDEELVKQAKEWFFEACTTSPQAQLIYEKFNQFIVNKLVAQKEAEEKAIEEADTALKKELKTEKAYKETVTLVQRTIKAFGGEELSELADKADIDGIKLGNHPVWLKAIAAIGKTMSEHNLVEGDILKVGEKEDPMRKIYDKSPEELFEESPEPAEEQQFDKDKKTYPTM